MEEGEKSPKRSSRGKGKGRSNRRLWALYGVLVVIAALLVVITAELTRSRQPPVALPPLGATEERSLPGNAPEVLSRQAPVKPDPSGGPALAVRSMARERPRERGILIFVIDDVGYNLNELKPFLSLPGPLTLSILPQLPDTRRAFQMITEAGKVAILHQPMEALAAINPGPGAIYATMSQGQVDEILTQNIAELPGIEWMNNHEGSKITSDRAVMDWVLSFAKEHHIQFLDSRTTSASVVESAAQGLGLPYFERNGPFLDDSVNRKAITAYIEAGAQVAEREGYAIMIGHVWDRDLPGILSWIYPKLLAEGFRFDTLRALPELVKDHESTGN